MTAFRFEMINENLPISEQWRLAAKKWVELDSAARLLEDCKTAAFSEMVNKMPPELSNARAENLVRGDKEWREYLVKMRNARTAANEQQVERDFIKMRFWEWNNHSADRRKELGM